MTFLKIPLLLGLLFSAVSLLAQSNEIPPLTPEQRAEGVQTKNLSNLETPYQITELGDTLKIDMRFSSKIVPLTTLSEHEQLKSDIRLLSLKIADYQSRLVDNLHEMQLLLQEKQNRLNIILINPSKN